MTAKNDLRRVCAQRLAPLLGDLAKIADHYGYWRTFSGALTAVGALGVLGSVLGATWLRVTFFTMAAAVLLVLTALAMVGLTVMQDRAVRAERSLHLYADKLRQLAPLSIQRWRQEMTIEPNGDAVIDLAVSFRPDNGHAKDSFFKVNYIAYGEVTPSPRLQRGVRHQAWRADVADVADVAARTRINSTSMWTSTTAGNPRIEILVDFGEIDREHNSVILQVRWPGYSSSLMRGRQPEVFDFFIQDDIVDLEFVTIFRGTAKNPSFVIRGGNASYLTVVRDRNDTIARVSQCDTTPGAKLSFTADFSD